MPRNRPQPANHKRGLGRHAPETRTKTGPIVDPVRTRNRQNRTRNEAEIDAIRALGNRLDDDGAGPESVLKAMQIVLHSVERQEDKQYQALRNACAQSVTLDDLRRYLDRLIMALDG